MVSRHELYHSKCDETYSTSIKFISENPGFEQRLHLYLLIYEEIGDLIPFTNVNLDSGHYFPYSESQYLLMSSLELALQGFYSYAFFSLRSFMELGMLGVSFAAIDNEHIEVQPWLHSEGRTPGQRDIFKSLNRIESFRTFDTKFKLRERVSKTMGELGGFVHTRGYGNSSQALNLANYSRFSQKSLQMFEPFMTRAVTDVVITMLLKYPIGSQFLPIFEKFGLEMPLGGFLEEHQVALIFSIIPEDEREFLNTISKQSKEVQTILKYINSLPDITEDEREQQLKRHEEFMSFYRSKK
ncbi:MAG: hypothetical protein P4L69_05900 [Desulfosporosinus sp.]|nr:hypothetical protein [Desulfosporosinus sp.]